MILDTKDVNLISKIAIGVSIPVMIIVGLSFGLQMYDTSGLENIQTKEFDIREQKILGFKMRFHMFS